jgi:hypothetical protein
LPLCTAAVARYHGARACAISHARQPLRAALLFADISGFTAPPSAWPNAARPALKS